MPIRHTRRFNNAPPASEIGSQQEFRRGINVLGGGPPITPIVAPAAGPIVGTTAGDVIADAVTGSAHSDAF